MRFRVSGKELEILEAQVRQEPFVVFGVRACDCRALEILDRVFLAEPEDSFTGTGGSMAPWYPWPARSRRRPASAEPLGLTPEIRREMCPPGSGRIPCISGPTRKGSGAPGRAASGRGRGDRRGAGPGRGQGHPGPAAPARPHYRGVRQEGSHAGAVPPAGVGPAVGEPPGAAPAPSSAPPASATTSKEFTGKEEVCRYRCWDSRMYSDFTLMSAGQPRPTQKERFRQRFLHKLQYFPVNQDGVFGCVGRGRCLQRCPIHMNIVKVMKTLGGAPHES